MPKSPTPPSSSRFVTLASVCVVLAGLYFAREVLIPLAMAMLLMFLLTPLVRRLERLRIPRAPAVLTVVCTAFLLLGVLGWVVAGQLVELGNNIEQYKDNIIAKVESLHPRNGVLERLSKTAADVEKHIDSASQPAAGATGAPIPAQPTPVRIVESAQTPIQTVWQYLGLILGPLGTAGIVIVFVLFMLLQREDLRNRLIRLVGFGQLTVTTQALDDAAARISRYLSMQALVNGITGTAGAAGLWVIGMTVGHSNPPFPNVVLWGLLIALLRFIPYIGPWVAASMPLLIAMAVYPGWAVFAWAVGWFIFVELVSNNVLEPLLYGSSTGMSAVAVLVSAVFWTWLWGPIGLLLATPLTVCMLVVGRYVPQLRFLDILLGDEPVLSPPERVFQRWLAMDQEEVEELVEENLTEHSLEETYDQAVLPALAMAKQDRHRGLLDERRQEFIRASLAELITELGDDQVVELARSGQKRMRIPESATVTVAVVASHDEEDELAGRMLAQLLEFCGFAVEVVPTASLASETVHRVAETKVDIVCLSSVPPSAITHARYLCKKILRARAETSIVVGLWTWRGDMEKARQRIACAESVQLVASLGGAIDAIEQLAQPLILRRQQSAVA